MNSSRQIKWGALLSYFSIAFNIISGLLYTPWMVETIGKNQYGLYSLANSLIALFLVDFGLSSATSRYLSKYNADGDREGAERFLGAVYKLYLLIDMVILFALTVVFLLLDRIYINLTPSELAQFKVVYVISALFSLINFPFVTLNGILTAYEKFVPLKIADLLYRFCNIGFTVIALLLGYGLYALVTVHAVVGLLTLCYKYAVIKKTVPVKVNFEHTEQTVYREIFYFSMWTTVSQLASRLVFNITPSILGIVSNSAEIAVFGVVNTIEGYTFTITTAISGLFMPQISKIVARNHEDNDLNRLFLNVGKFQYVLNGLIISGFAVVGQIFVNLWMGNDYSQSYLGILLVIIPGLFCSSLQVADTTIVVMNKVKLSALVSVVTGVINVFLSFPLSKFFGVTGACLSICIAFFIRDVLLHIIYQRELPLNIPQFMKECYGKMSVPIIITIAIGSILNQYIPDGGWGLFLIKTVLVTVIYFTTLFIFALSKQERNKVLAILKIRRGA